MHTVEEKDHPWWYVFAHTHFNIRTGVEWTSRVHHEYSNCSEDEVDDSQEQEQSEEEWTRDEPKDADEEKDYECDYGDDEVFEPALPSQQEFHDYMIKLWDWYQ
jgi:hypothetical protein